MDLIYADENKKDIGVLSAYRFDMAFGNDENDFTCILPRDDHCCDHGYIIYVEGEEYGGIIDSVGVNVDDDEVIYSGRTWHGVLESKILCPDKGQDYLILNGEANAVLRQLITRIGLNDLFDVPTDSTPFTFASYQMERYIPAYTGIRKMLRSVGAKLVMKWGKNGKVILSATVRYDYSQDEEFEPSQVIFEFQKDFRKVNHLICLGQGDLRQRAVIHLFTDENGGVQQYLKNGISVALEDSDYILDTSKQVLTGSDEVSEVYELSNAEITTNYKVLTSKPSDWERNCEKYFSRSAAEDGFSYDNVQKVEIGYVVLGAQPADWSTKFSDYYVYRNGEFVSVEGGTVYTALTSKPSNWDTSYTAYYKKNGNDYVTPEGVTTSQYVRQTVQPADWSTNYGSYYYLYSDGVTSEYRSVDGVSYRFYKLQTQEPTDWKTNYGNYFRLMTAKEVASEPTIEPYKAVTLTKKEKVPAWKPKKYYTSFSNHRAPAWNLIPRYSLQETTSAPTWVSGQFYVKRENVAPAWSAGRYYYKSDAVKAPAWSTGKYYKEVTDRYAAMVEGALDRLAEYYETDELELDLAETDQVYDIDDIVGVYEEVTGLSAAQSIIKKVVKIQNDDVVISYGVG